MTCAPPHAASWSLDEAGVFKREFHLHVPAGAIPKDGPSAGVAMATAIASLLTGRPVRRAVGLTGEVTLQGRVLPIGGVKQKVLAARAAGLTTVILPERNRADLEEIPADAREEMEFHLVMTIDEVLALALEPAESGAGLADVAAVSSLQPRPGGGTSRGGTARAPLVAGHDLCLHAGQHVQRVPAGPSGHLPQHVVGAPRAAGDRGGDRAQPEPPAALPTVAGSRLTDGVAGSPRWWTPWRRGLAQDAERRGRGRKPSACTHLVQLNPPADLDHPVVEGPRRIREPAPWRMSSPRPSRAERVIAADPGGLVLGDPVARGEDPLAERCPRPHRPTPKPDRVMALRRPFEGPGEDPPASRPARTRTPGDHSGRAAA